MGWDAKTFERLRTAPPEEKRRLPGDRLNGGARGFLLNVVFQFDRYNNLPGFADA